MMKRFESKLENILNYGMLKITWDKLESNIKVSPYVSDLKTLMNSFSQNIKSNINNVYVIRALKLVSESTNNKFIDYLFRIKRINLISVQRLSVDFAEIKQQLY